MASSYGLPLAEIESVFTEQIAALEGKIVDTFRDDTRLFARSILAREKAVRPNDRLQGGIALRATDEGIWVYPYVFRQICRNGAIRAHAAEGKQIEYPGRLDREEILSALRQAVRACGTEEALSVAAAEMRSAQHAPADAALSMIPLLSRLSSQAGTRSLMAILDRFQAEEDRTQFGLMNAITSVARDTPDPDLRWRLEELGGGVPVGVVPTDLLVPGMARPLREQELALRAG
jgi:hypothetical protein